MSDDRKQDLIELEKLLADKFKFQNENRLKLYKPYPKQLEFHASGLKHRQRLLMAANRVGKTYCGGAEVAYHLTGLYPAWWTGRRWDRPTQWWAAGITALSTREVVQEVLIGAVAMGWGTGMIPKDCLSRDKMTLARGVSDLYDTVLVKHVSGGFSEVKFKSYEQGREKWQGATLDGLWFDEEPSEEIYTEGTTRVALNNGISLMTFTPLLGMSTVVKRFLNERTKDMAVTTMTIEDAGHVSKEQIESIVAAYPAHEREARARGIPMLGSGVIFDIPESQISCKPREIPSHWALVWGVDFGVKHPFAAVLMAWDKDTDTLCVIHTIRMKASTPLHHAEAMKNVLKGYGAKIPVAWPHDGNQRKDFGGDLVPLRSIYKKYGLNMHAEHATFPGGSNSTEVGVLTMYERMKTNRFKVFENLTDWFEEYRMYHRKDGAIVKVDDDLMSASRMAVMMLRIARPVLFYGEAQRRQEPVAMAKGLDEDPWAR